MRVSDLAMAILHPESADERQNALRQAATAPALFRDLAELRGASDENLISRLVRQGFTEAGAKLAVASFRKTMSLVSGEATGYDEPHDESEPVVGPWPQAARQSRGTGQMSTNRGSAMMIPLPGGVVAELRLPDPITPEALKAVVDWLGHAPTVAEATPDAEVSPPAELATSAPELPDVQSPTSARD